MDDQRVSWQTTGSLVFTVDTTAMIFSVLFFPGLQIHEHAALLVICIHVGILNCVFYWASHQVESQSPVYSPIFAFHLISVLTHAVMLTLGCYVVEAFTATSLTVGALVFFNSLICNLFVVLISPRKPEDTHSVVLMRGSLGVKEIMCPV